MLIVALAPFADELFDADGVEQALLAAALLPLVQVVRERRRDGSCSCTAATTCGASTRPDRLRSGSSPSSSPLPYGVDRGAPGDRPRAGDLDARDLRRSASLRCADSRQRRAKELGEDVPEIRAFVVQSSLATGVISLRTTLVPLILGVVVGTTQVGLFRIAQTPQTGLAAASSPARLVLLTEQTRDWEKGERVARARRACAATRSGPARSWSSAVPVFFVAMPWLIRVVFGSEYDGAVHGRAGDPARSGNPLRTGLDEVPPRHDRAAATADRDPRARDARGDPARGRARGRVGRDGRCGRRPGFDARLRRRLARGDHASPSRGARSRAPSGTALQS